MGNRTTRTPGPRRQEAQRPSLFFFIALGIGVLLLLWLMWMAATRPVAPPQTTTTATSQTSS